LDEVTREGIRVKRIRTLDERFRVAAPPALMELVTRLGDAGFDAVVVGGPVRDLLLDRPVVDWDVATSASPTEVAARFERTTLLHADHGTTQVRIGSTHFEVTTYRVDGPYSDGRRPDFVNFTRDLGEDLARRDFTVNAIAYDPIRTVVTDPFQGVEDLDRRVLRTVGRPEDRFREDALRLMRAARFVAILEFELAAGVAAAMQREAPGLDRIAPERIRDELQKLLGARVPSTGLELMADTDLLARVLPELDATRGVTQNEYHHYTVYEHSLRAADAVDTAMPLVRLAALLHDVGKPPTRQVRDGRVTFYNHERVGAEMVAARLRFLRYPRRDVDIVTHLVAQHMFHYAPDWSDAAVRRLIARVQTEHLDNLFALRVADTLAKGPDAEPPEDLPELRGRIEREVNRETAFRVQDLAVSGRDLMRELALGEGPEVGRILGRLLDHVLERGVANSREALLSEARRIVDEEAGR